MEFISSLIDFIFPRHCLHCKESLYRQEEFLCLDCFRSLPFTGNIEFRENSTEQLFWGRFQFEMAFSYLYYLKDGITQSLVHSLKYHKNLDLGRYLGRKMGTLIKTHCGNTFDLIVPLPLHKKKLKVRGFNQSQVLAEGISETSGIPIAEESVSRTVYQGTQTRKSRYERYTNVSGIFDVYDSKALTDKHVLIIDDVVTTGATIEALVEAIHLKSNAKVSIATVGVASL